MVLTFDEAQKKVDSWIKKSKDGYWSPLSMFASLVEEVGELGREINKLEGFKRKNEFSLKDLELELGDALFSLICVANYLKLDLSSALINSIKKFENRKTMK